MYSNYIVVGKKKVGEKTHKLITVECDKQCEGDQQNNGIWKKKNTNADLSLKERFGMILLG